MTQESLLSDTVSIFHPITHVEYFYRLQEIESHLWDQSFSQTSLEKTKMENYITVQRHCNYYEQIRQIPSTLRSAHATCFCA